MPQFKQYPGENPVDAQKRIAANKAKAQKPLSTKAKSDMLANNVSSTIKNMGY